LTVDLPIDEIEELRAPLAAKGVGVVPLVAPTSTDDRIARVRALGAPFVYYVSLTGVTGAALASASLDPARLASIRAATGSPVAVGFGIKTPDDARAVAALADGVVVGSAVVSRIADGDPAGAPQRVADLVSSLAKAIKP
jgi:tryptophan synthase alpha chain